MARGGKRQGAGRPAPGGTGKRVNVYFKADVLEWLNRNGNVSDEIDKLAREKMGAKDPTKLYLATDKYGNPGQDEYYPAELETALNIKLTRHYDGECVWYTDPDGEIVLASGNHPSVK